MIDHKTLELEIRCRPSKLPETVPVDVTFKVGEAIHVDDLPQIDGVEYLANGIQVVVSCQPPTVAAASSESTESAVEADSVPVINEQVEEGQKPVAQKIKHQDYFGSTLSFAYSYNGVCYKSTICPR